MSRPSGVSSNLWSQNVKTTELTNCTSSPLQFCQSGFDAFSEDCIHDEVLVEETLPAVLVPLKDHEVAVVGDFAANSTDLLRIK